MNTVENLRCVQMCIAANDTHILSFRFHHYFERYTIIPSSNEAEHFQKNVSGLAINVSLSSGDVSRLMRNAVQKPKLDEWKLHCEPRMIVW